MPASMIKAPTGGRPKVIGSSIATVAMVPMPGNTPTSVPTSAPIKHSRRLIGVKATAKPRARLEKSSAITPSLNREHAGRGACAERKSMHALQIARRPQGEQRDGNQRQAADKILRTTNPFRHDVFDRPTARRVTHRSLSP